MKGVISLFNIFFLTSCATVMNTHYTEVNLYTKQDRVKVYINDSTHYAYTPTTLIVERSRKPLYLTLEKDTLKKGIEIPRRLSPEFWIGNLINGTAYFGLLIDLSNEKRFKYPTNVFVDVHHPQEMNLRYKSAEKPTLLLSQKGQGQKTDFTVKKGTFNIKMSIPEGNSFIINKETHIGNSFGFLGITTGVDYYYKDNGYFGVGAGTLTDFIIPIPAPYDVMGEYERSFGSYLDILHGINIHRFSVNYGVSVSKYSYYKRITEELFPNYVDKLLYSKKENRIGLSLSSKYSFTDYFNVCIKYLPSFYTLETKESRYGHFLFLDIAINYTIKTGRG